jgi:hypothetical protein
MATTLYNDRRKLSEAEQRLFTALGMEHRSGHLPLMGAPVEHARVIETGEGPPVLLVHGAGMSASLWAPLLVHLTHRHCLAVDLPGCGLTDPFDHRGIDLRSHARSFLAAVLDVLDLDVVPIVANSLGSTYSLYLASAKPVRISHLALFGAPGVALPGGRGSLAMSLYSRPRWGRLMSAVSPRCSPVSHVGFSPTSVGGGRWTRCLTRCSRSQPPPSGSATQPLGASCRSCSPGGRRIPTTRCPTTSSRGSAHRRGSCGEARTGSSTRMMAGEPPG